MEINIIKATEKHFKQAQKLSKQCSFDVSNGKVKKVGIGNILSKVDINGLYVVVNSKNEVLGCIVVDFLSSKDDNEWFNLDENEKAVECKRLCCVDKKVCKEGIGFKLLEYVKNNFKEYDICADILSKPVENIASVKTATKSGFIKIDQKDWFHKNWNTTLTWGIYKLEN